MSSNLAAKGIAPPPLVALYEDRLYQLPGLKVLLLSLSRYCPSWPVRLRFPGATESLRNWLRRCPQVELIDEKLDISGSYNVKPAILLDALATGARSCLWLDTDVLVNGNLDFLLSVDVQTIVVTQDPWEYADGSTHRSRTWELNAGRSLPGPLNTAAVQVTPAHRDLLLTWQQLLGTARYLAEQAKDVHIRNGNMLGDQDVLSALLASEKFASIPVLRLRHGIEILQHHGAAAYALQHRWHNITHGMPPLLHAMGSVKPWRMPPQPSPFLAPRDYYERVYLELSPYVHFARAYEAELEENGDWLQVRTLAGRADTITAINHPAIKGALQAFLHRLGRKSPQAGSTYS
jgi:hypothetical protein